MKKAIVILMAMVITICATIGVSADSNVGNTYQIGNVTVIFDEDSQLSNEQQEAIANLLVDSEYGVAQANLICNIFGHKNTQEGVSTITHKESETDPRCLQEIFTITTCSRCNESTVERNGMFYISCCPED
jgi:hypothetical protein